MSRALGDPPLGCRQNQRADCSSERVRCVQCAAGKCNVGLSRQAHVDLRVCVCHVSSEFAGCASTWTVCARCAAWERGVGSASCRGRLDVALVLGSPGPATSQVDACEPSSLRWLTPILHSLEHENAARRLCSSLVDTRTRLALPAPTSTRVAIWTRERGGGLGRHVTGTCLRPHKLSVYVRLWYGVSMATYASE